ncbi:hypothetical protein [Methylophaga thiooxydans]|uniref:hypothetical protein n=1 Tax=Methylophaga thiooxydans TaxID=392484 RepID=UPI002354B5DA|nr:hypothetical protein [Methylophaga thiooxydans]
MNAKVSTEQQPIKTKLLELVDDILAHDGYGDIRVEVRILKRQQKEVILHCGKQYRYVIDAPAEQSSQAVKG